MTEKISVMIVEDQELTRMGFKAMIDDNPDMKVVAEASDGESAVEIAVNLRPDVVVMDIGLPFIDGIEAGRRIRLHYPELKLLMLTSHKESALVFAAMASGARGYCLKDVSLKRLCLAVRAVAGGDVWLDPEIAGVLFASLGDEEQKSVAESQLETANNSPQNNRRKQSIGPSDELSERELEVLQLLVQGLKNNEIAEELCVTIDTVKSHMSRIMDKLSASDRTQAALMALRRGIVSL